eukprot:TRINITY_DN6297_c0_g1_i1.p1 TRINITY_DN6297_c0_g1~~TRINITY_DN6297_c0_g1_i1.p1  ORF type:complete len:191 (+),score=30.47 TRINITY_DN6297_c0_g1_i1:76-648(+)
MEKYSKWRDKGTGIHPFLVPLKAKGNGAFMKYLVGPLLAVPRLMAAAALAILLFSLLALTSILPSALRLRFLAQRCICFVLCRALLLVMGFWNISSSYSRLQKRHPLPTMWPVGGVAGAGHLIVCNKLSYVDVFYLAFRFNPIFTTAAVGGAEAEVSRVHSIPFQPLIPHPNSLCAPPLLSPSCCESLSH